MIVEMVVGTLRFMDTVERWICAKTNHMIILHVDEGYLTYNHMHSFETIRSQKALFYYLNLASTQFIAVRDDFT